MDTIRDILLALILLLWSAIVAIFGWGLDHLFEIAVIFGLFVFVPSCMGQRGASGQLADVFDKLEEISGQLDEISKQLDESSTRENSGYDDDEFMHSPSKEEPKPTKPYPY